MNEAKESKMTDKGNISFIQNGKTYHFHDNTAHEIHDQLPPGNYVVQKNPMSGELFLEKVGSFPKFGKVYGNITKQTSRILNTFLDRPSGTGVLLTGEKGSGKTMLAKSVCMEAAKKHGFPTLIVNQPLAGEGFNKFIQTINQPMVVLFDEFEKVYNAETQELMLTLLDGTYPSKKLFLLTSNDKWRMNEHMRNRPGRIFYMMEFDGLDANFIREYCEDTLIDKGQVESVVKLSGFYSKFNFDMLKAIVEEMNRYGETAQEALKMLNAKVEYAGKQTYTITTFYKGKPMQGEGERVKEWTGNPVSDRVEIYFEDPESKDKDDPDYVHEIFTPEHIHAIDPANETTTYKQGDVQIILKRKWARGYDVWSSGVF